MKPMGKGLWSGSQSSKGRSTGKTKRFYRGKRGGGGFQTTGKKRKRAGFYFAKLWQKKKGGEKRVWDRYGGNRAHGIKKKSRKYHQ